MKKAHKGYLINLSGVHEIEIRGLADMQNAVGGYIEKAHEWSNGDTAYCNEEGLLQPVEFFTHINGAHQPFAGPVLVLGSTKAGENCDVKLSQQYFIENTRCGQQLVIFGSGFPNEPAR